MMKRLAVLLASFTFVTLLVTQWGEPEKISADFGKSQQFAVILSDGSALAASEKGHQLTASFLGLLATLRPDLPLMFINVDDPSKVVGPILGNELGIEEMGSDVENVLHGNKRVERGGIAYALLAATDFLGDQRAASGSEVYLITGEGSGTDVRQLSHRSSLVVPNFRENGWLIHTLSLAGISSDFAGLLDEISSSSGGQDYELSVGNGFKSITDSILSMGSKGSLHEIGQRTLTRTELFTSWVSVVPGTRETTLLFFMESPYGSIRLTNPDGFEVSVGDRRESYMTETPNVVVWRMVDPAPGNWKIDVRGMEGLFSAWDYSSNMYSLFIKSPGPVPLGEPTTMVGYISDGASVVKLSGAKLSARLTTADGTSLLLDMHDNGQRGDAKANDGFYSMTLPPLSSEGDHMVEMELSWADYDHKVATQTSFEVRPFPAIEVDPLSVKDLEIGVRTQIAAVNVHVRGAPYPVSVEAIQASVISGEGLNGMVEVEPKRLYDNGPAWEYEVYFTPTAGSHTLSLWMQVEYAGRQYMKATDSYLLSSMPIPALEEASPPLPVMPAISNSSNSQVQSVPVNSSVASMVENPQPSGFSWPLFFMIGLLVLGLAVLVVYLMNRTRPHGYLFDDSDQPLIEFSKVKRNPIASLMRIGYVKGSQINVPGLEGVAFKFSRGGVKLSRVSDEASVRVNNQPLVNEILIKDRTWIGSRGKLYSFFTSGGPVQEGASAD